MSKKTLKINYEEVKSLMEEMNTLIADFIESDIEKPATKVLEAYGVVCFLSETLYGYLDYMGVDKDSLEKLKESFVKGSRDSVSREMLSFTEAYTNNLVKN